MRSFGYGGNVLDGAASNTAAAAPSACPACRSSAVTTTAKSPDANSYWRCESCGEVWNVGRSREGRMGAGRWR